MTVTIWHARGCLTASFDPTEGTLTNFPRRPMARLILDNTPVTIKPYNDDYWVMGAGKKVRVAWGASDGVAVLVWED